MTDFSELNDLAADLSHAGLMAGVKALRVVEQSCQRVEQDARDNAPRKRLPHYAAKITHDVTVEGGSVVGEVGPERGGQGSLGHILEYGAPRANFQPRPHLGPALDREEPTFVNGIERIGGEIL